MATSTERLENQRRFVLTDLAFAGIDADGTCSQCECCVHSMWHFMSPPPPPFPSPIPPHPLSHRFISLPFLSALSVSFRCSYCCIVHVRHRLALCDSRFFVRSAVARRMARLAFVPRASTGRHISTNKAVYDVTQTTAYFHLDGRALISSAQNNIRQRAHRSCRAHMLLFSFTARRRRFAAEPDKHSMQHRQRPYLHRMRRV